MGFFNSISQFVSGTHDQSRGIYLINELQGTYNALKQMDRRVANDILERFRINRRYVLEQISNPHSEPLKLALELQKDAKDCYHTDLIESYSLWLTGAWLESRERNSDASREAYELFNEMAQDIDINEL